MPEFSEEPVGADRRDEPNSGMRLDLGISSRERLNRLARNLGFPNSDGEYTGASRPLLMAGGQPLPLARANVKFEGAPKPHRIRGFGSCVSDCPSRHPCNATSRGDAEQEPGHRVTSAKPMPWRSGRRRRTVSCWASVWAAGYFDADAVPGGRFTTTFLPTVMTIKSSPTSRGP